MTEEKKQKADAQLDILSKSPYPVWALAGLSALATPLAGKVPGIPSAIQGLGFAGIFGFSGYVTNTGDYENGAGITTAWCLAWSFLNLRRAIISFRPASLLLGGAVMANTVIYGRRTLIDNGYILTS
ncbi:uncharacterized protein VTP21DRAFT_11090 [Calcarisporiella thermophila]|uniref:uncharacterized protein n=1 Tax=Calcarisporiella thermophila TaxID=911321 RepID=UPI003742B5A0